MSSQSAAAASAAHREKTMQPLPQLFKTKLSEKICERNLKPNQSGTVFLELAKLVLGLYKILLKLINVFSIKIVKDNYLFNMSYLK